MLITSFRVDEKPREFRSSLSLAPRRKMDPFMSRLGLTIFFSVFSPRFALNFRKRSGFEQLHIQDLLGLGLDDLRPPSTCSGHENENENQQKRKQLTRIELALRNTERTHYHYTTLSLQMGAERLLHIPWELI